MRRGNEEVCVCVCVCEIVRPGMEDSESAEKQENTGIGPASACCGCLYGSFAARDVRPHPEERGCRDVSQTRTRVRASRRMRTAAARPSCFETHRSAFGVRKRLRSRRAARLLSMRGRGSINLRLHEIATGAISLFPIDINNGNCNSNVSGRQAPCVTPHVTPDVPPSVIPHMSPSVVIMCFGFEAPCHLARPI